MKIDKITKKQRCVSAILWCLCGCVCVCGCVCGCVYGCGCRYECGYVDIWMYVLMMMMMCCDDMLYEKSDILCV